jgi:hypothetical protein
VTEHVGDRFERMALLKHSRGETVPKGMGTLAGDVEGTIESAARRTKSLSANHRAGLLQ